MSERKGVILDPYYCGDYLSYPSKEVIDGAKALLLRAGVPDLLEKCAKSLKNECREVKVREVEPHWPALRVGIALDWNFSGNNQQLMFERVLVTAWSSTKTIVVHGAQQELLLESQWSDIGVLKDAIVYALTHPGKRVENKSQDGFSQAF